MSSGNEKVVESWFDAFNRQDWDSYADHLTDDMIYIDQYEGNSNKEITMQHMKSPNQPWEDSVVLRVDRMISSEDSVVVEWTWQARHIGEFMGVEPSGKVFEVPIVFILDFKDGKIRRIRNMHNVDYLRAVMRGL